MSLALDQLNTSDPYKQHDWARLSNAINAALTTV